MILRFKILRCKMSNILKTMELLLLAESGPGYALLKKHKWVFPFLRRQSQAQIWFFYFLNYFHHQLTSTGFLSFTFIRYHELKRKLCFWGLEKKRHTNFFNASSALHSQESIYSKHTHACTYTHICMCMCTWKCVYLSII